MQLKIPRQQIPTPEEAFSDLLGISSGVTTVNLIAIDKLHPYSDQPFKAYSEEKLNELANDIVANGVISPVIIRPDKQQAGCYEILAGHNRTRAAHLAGLNDVPCIIMDLNDDAAALIMVNTNLNQRQELLPSEKALAYKLQQECMSRIGGSAGVVKEIAQKSSESVRNIQRYIRLAELSSELLSLVDVGRIAVLAGVELTHLEIRNQNHLSDYLQCNRNIKLDIKQATALRELEQVHDLYNEYIMGILSPDKKQPSSMKIRYNKIAEYLPQGCEDAEQYIFEALEFYKNNHIQE